MKKPLPMGAVFLRVPKAFGTLSLGTTLPSEPAQKSSDERNFFARKV